MKQSPTYWSQLYLCVALTTMATLLLELSLTRIFSVVFYYHFAFLAISIALFGLGTGGVFSYVVAGWKGAAVRQMGRLSALNGLLVIVALAIILAQGNDPSKWDLAAGLLHHGAALLRRRHDRIAGDFGDHRARQSGLFLRSARAPPAAASC